MSLLLTTTTIFLPHAANVLHEAALGLGERAIGGRDEKHQIGARDELGGHRLVLADDGVGSRRVDDADFAEQIDRRLDDEQIGLAHGLLGLVAVLEHGDDGGRRRDAFLHQRLADERVDERALARVELADDDEQEQLVELRDRLIERLLLVVGARRCAQAPCAAASAEPALRAGVRPVVGKYACQHVLCTARIRPSVRCKRQCAESVVTRDTVMRYACAIASRSTRADVSAAVWIVSRMRGVNPGCRPDSLPPLSSSQS